MRSDKNRSHRPSLSLHGMWSMSLLAEKGEELTYRNLYIANDFPRDR